jgi:hypothetical protein
MIGEDITIIRRVRLKCGLFSRVYYYQGNIFRPFGYSSSKVRKLVEIRIRMWLHKNREMILADRAKPGYKTLTELAAEQMGW